MTVKIFLTGASGYIGGTALEYIHKAHPDYEYTLLVRNEEKGKPIKEKYPKATLLYGSLEDSGMVRDAAKAADIVIDTADSSDNYPGAVAIGKGLEEGHTDSKPGYWIHLSGTSILTWYDVKNGRNGEAPLPEEKYHDIDDIERLFDLPDDAEHRDIDQIVQLTTSDAVRAAIVCPPTIYDTGSGTINTRSMQVPNMVRSTLLAGFAPIIGKGLTEWDHIHIDDLGELYVKLVDATQDSSKNSNPEIFGSHAYFFAENGSHLWADVAKEVAEECHRQGYIAEPLTKHVTGKDINKTSTLGLNSKGVAARAKKYLDWTPKGKPLKETLAALVTSEATALNLTPKYK